MLHFRGRSIAPPAEALSIPPGTGATLAVTVAPAAGWVRVAANVEGVPAGEECRLLVVGRDGTRESAGTWLVSEPGGFTLVPPDQVTAVEVENLDGRHLGRTPIT